MAKVNQWLNEVGNWLTKSCVKCMCVCVSIITQTDRSHEFKKQQNIAEMK